MKRDLLIFHFCLYSIFSFAQAPQKFSYQAIIRNSSNTLLINTVIGMKVSIIQGSINGTSVFSETHNINTDANGLITLEIGGGTVVQGTFAIIDWSKGPYFVKTETDPNGGSNYTLISTAQLLSVPYALYAERSGNAGGGFQHYVGEVFGGGVVFYVSKGLDGKEHGLIVAPVNQSDSLESWSNVDTVINNGLMTFDDGLLNTNTIINQTGHTSSAALLCTNYRGGGFTDWYLPSIQEFQLIIKNSATINETLKNITNSKLIFDYNVLKKDIYKIKYFRYWTSTEWFQTFEGGKFAFIVGFNYNTSFGQEYTFSPLFYEFPKNTKNQPSYISEWYLGTFPAVRAIRRF
jgi:hypothetical protein